MYGYLFLLVLLCLNARFSEESSNDLNKLGEANNELGVKLYQRLIKNTDENVFFSPLSISTAFGMLFVGTGGNSAKQLRKVLGYSAAKLSNSKVSSAFDQYLTKVLQKNTNYDLNIANEILLAKNFKVLPKYKECVRHFFHALVKDVDFAQNANQILKDVNDWVSKQTHGKIEKFLDELNPSTLLLILNAVYFKGTWKTQFNKSLTKDEVFYNHGQENKAKRIPFMHVKEKFSYFQNGDYQVLELPYKGKDISMLILLPNKLDGLQEIEESFSVDDIKTIQEQLRPTKIPVSLPRFKINYSRELIPDFNALGAKDIFNPSLSDFSGITQSKGLSVNQVIHKAAIEVNEEGSEAAAATGIGITRLILRPSFSANHPFMFMIIDKRNSLVLFMGRVTNF